MLIQLYVFENKLRALWSRKVAKLTSTSILCVKEWILVLLNYTNVNPCMLVTVVCMICGHIYSTVTIVNVECDVARVGVHMHVKMVMSCLVNCSSCGLEFAIGSVSIEQCNAFVDMYNCNCNSKCFKPI